MEAPPDQTTQNAVSALPGVGPHPGPRGPGTSRSSRCRRRGRRVRRLRGNGCATGSRRDWRGSEPAVGSWDIRRWRSRRRRSTLCGGSRRVRRFAGWAFRRRRCSDASANPLPTQGGLSPLNATNPARSDPAGRLRRKGLILGRARYVRWGQTSRYNCAVPGHHDLELKHSSRAPPGDRPLRRGWDGCQFCYEILTPKRRWTAHERGSWRRAARAARS